MCSMVYVEEMMATFEDLTIQDYHLCPDMNKLVVGGIGLLHQVGECNEMIVDG